MMQKTVSLHNFRHGIIRAFKMQHMFFRDYLKLVDTYASTFIFSNASLDWLILRTKAFTNLTLITAGFLLVFIPHGFVSPARIRGFQSYEMSHTPHQGDIQRDTLSFNITPTQPAPHVLVASRSRTHEAEQCQSNEPLDIEIERIRKEREQVTKLHKEKKLMLITEFEKEITEIQKKYDAIIHESEVSLTDQLKIFEDYHQLVNANKLLAEFIIHHCGDTLNLHGPEKDTSSIAVPQVPASATVRPANQCSTSVRPANPCSTSVRPANLCSTGVLTPRFSGQNFGMRGLRAPAPHLRSSSLFSSVHNRPATREPLLEPLPTISTLETLPHIQTAPNTGVQQVDLKNIPKLPMEFYKYYGIVGPSFPILSSNHNTS